ncbi:hypothetical protein [Winogradskyella sp. 3972H.M.0a.05]|uniref:hypothetical protein n=1 Tax=Winogradskyella sp. 3972H.M.0a.05 TaxID=2950277 RepID=UPI00339A8421
MRRRLFIGLLTFVVLIVALFYFNVIWRSPSYYTLEQDIALEVPIVDMKAYMDTDLKDHERPYIFEVESPNNNGKVVVLGVEHRSDKTHPQFEAIRQHWKDNNPTVALVEGRLGFYFSWFQDPIESYGESGLTASLAKKSNVPLYSWEPERHNEVSALAKKYDTKQLAAFYVLRPFFGHHPDSRKENAEDMLQSLIKDRTDYPEVAGAITSWEEIDEIWNSEFPDIDWRTYNTGYGWPGSFHEIWNSSNLYRDEHMVKIILEQVGKGETVFITMGASHAPRVENTLKHQIMK